MRATHEMDLGLSGKVVLVGGASRGLGYAISEAVVHEGAHVVMCSRESAAIDAAAERLPSLSTGSKVVPVTADVATDEGCQRLVQTALDRFGRVDALVCNSGGPRPGSFDDVQANDWSAAVDLLLFSAVRLTRLILPSMRHARSGAIIYITGYGVRA